MEKRLRWSALLAAVAIVAGAATAVAASARQAGPRADGTAITPNGWVVTPAGKQVDLADATWWADRPISQALSPDGRWLLVGSDGASNQSLKLVETAGGTVRQTIQYVAPEALFVGLAWSPDGQHAYAAAGNNNKLRRYDFSGGVLAERTPIPVPGFPAGLAVAPDGGAVYVAENTADAMAVVDVSASAVVASVPLGPCTEGSDPVQYPSSPFFPAQCQPYGVTLSADARTAYVSDWGGHTVTVINTLARAAIGKIAVGTHPIGLVTNPQASRHEAYVANGDSDSVSVIDTLTNTVSRTIDLAPYPGAPVGSNPVALTVSADGRWLYVVNGGNNDVAVLDLEATRKAVKGMIPTAWYPSGVQISGDGKTLFVINAKGLGAGPNPGYQQGKYGPPNQYVGAMMHGSLSIIPTPGAGELERYTQQVVRNNGFDGRDQVRTAPEAGEGHDGTENRGSVIPSRVGGASPIKHVIYVVKENRTYDQVFGSLGKGNGDPSLNLFGDESATNIRSLARRFVTLDNFYASSEVSADGWNWSTAANANPYVQRTWPQNYSDVSRRNGYDFEGGNFATAPNRNPHDAYLWDRLADSGVSFRNYGFFTLFGSSPSVPQPTAKNLSGRTAPNFPGYNTKVADSPCGPAPLAKPDRYSAWEAEFKEYEAGNNLPTFEFLRLPNDHTRGTSPGWPTPRQYVADNDYALGKVVQTVSHSKYWKSTAIFVLEDDAQDGPDHVDAHRMEALVISPYTQTGKVDSTLYSTVSMLRTMELVVGLRPLTQFDAAATPMLNSFSSRSNTRPYDVVVPPAIRSGSGECAGGTNDQDLGQGSGNTDLSPMASESATMNFDGADLPDNRLLNQAIWQSVKGSASAMPGPIHGTVSPPISVSTGQDSDG